ncbi:MAG: response regulator [Phycisphaerae bacterium]
MAGPSGKQGLYAPSNGDQELHHSLLVLAFQQAGEGIVIADSSGVIHYANPQFESMAGLEVGQAQGKHIRSLQSEYRNDDQFREMLRTVAEGHDWRGRWELEYEAGHQRILEARVTPLRSGSGHINGFVGVHHDVTREVSLECKLREAQKMEAAGRLAGGVAHDFNNLLTAIMGNAQILHMQLNQSDLQARAEKVLDASRRAAKLTSKLMAFAQLGSTELASVDIHELLTSAAEQFNHQTAPDVRISLELRADPAVTLGDPQHLAETVSSILDNAVEAVGPSGHIVLETSHVHIEPLSPQAEQTDLMAGRYIRISIFDDGKGMDAEVLSHVFEPFFTTKPNAEGAGMSMAHAYGCVRSHGGTVQVFSRPQEGTRVDVYLPCGQPAAVQGQGPDEEDDMAEASSGGGRIMIIDDEAAVREVACDALKEFGHEVLAFESGQQAVDWFSENHDQVDLVLLDLIMPRMDGRQTYQKMRSINPEVKVVICTGYSTSEMASRVLAEGVLDFLAKPYRLSELAEVVERYLPKKA